MGFKTPVATVDTTGTSGTSTYTLNAATPGDGKQNLQQAVTKGVVSNGDVIYYLAVDITTKGDDLLYERGKGTVGNGGLTVTRDEVFENHLGTTATVAWSAGGTRAFIVNAGDFLNSENNLSDIASAATARTNLAVPGLATTNTYTETQTIDKSAAGTFFAALELRNSATGATGNRVLNRAWVKNSAGTFREALRIDSQLSTITAGAETARTTFSAYSGGVFATRLDLSGSDVKDGSGNKFVAFPTGGTVKMLFSSAPPTGWTRVNETNQAIIRLATAADTPNASGGSDSFFDGGWATNTHTLQISEIPSHTHPPGGTGADLYYVLDLDAGTNAFNVGSNSGTPQTPTATGATGGGGSHAHNMATPFYRIACWATYD